MDYSGFNNFPFPMELPQDEQKRKDSFLALSDAEQLQLLSGCHSYSEFKERLSENMKCD
ncbi:MAG: hypothetical protein RSA78_08405 [Oscillospiraceae bacterium]